MMATVPEIPMVIRVEKALEAIYICCFGQDPIEEEDVRLLCIMLNVVFPSVGQSVSKFSDARLLYEGNNIQRRPNTALLLEEIKQEVDNFDTVTTWKKWASIDSHAVNGESDSKPKSQSGSWAGLFNMGGRKMSGRTRLNWVKRLKKSNRRRKEELPSLMMTFREQGRNANSL
ncbi:hypothetical protein Cni_G02243 [Canna indica]|uniref:Uncharacterized protein n=1 Tax=Canna indica TaxID=4628 RepID=A0AAQ3JP30_9LILI|nr:hypothetical protein Cni_G02243 [Canna indica]